jgi:hypothetical protein
MLELQALAERAHPANRGAIDDAIAILVGQQRVIREMVESMLAGELATKVAIAPVLDALAMQWRQTGRKLTWTLLPPDAALDASDDLAFRLKLLETLGPIEAPALAVDVRAGETLDVTLSGASLPTVRFSMEAGA